MASAAQIRLKALTRREIYSDTTNIANGASNSSGFLDVSKAKNITIFASSTGGTYQLQFIWSRDGSTTLWTETITVVAGGRSNQVVPAAPFVQVKVNNTGGAPFSAHLTSISVDAM
jgi:hypothetical protein